MLVYLNRQFLFPLFILWSVGLVGQVPVKTGSTGSETIKTEPIEVLSPKGVNVSQPGLAMVRYSGNVKLRHKGVLLFCDQAIHQTTANRIEAIGHVLIVQGDTIIVKADTLVYEGATRQAVLSGRVTFQDRRIILNTVQLDYNLTAGIAHYIRKGRLIDSRNVLTSHEGYYDTQSRQIELQHTVRLVSPDNTLTSEALIYSTLSRVATLVEPTRITGKEGISVAQQGQYNTQENVMQQNTTVQTLKYARTDESPASAPIHQSIMSPGSLAILAANDPLPASEQIRIPATAGKSVTVKTTPVKVVAAPMPMASDRKKAPLTAPVSQRDSIYASTAAAGGRLPNPSGTKVNTAVKSPVAKRQPIKSEETTNVVVGLVSPPKPDEQVTLAAFGPNHVVKKAEEPVPLSPADSVSAAPAKQPDMPVRLTGVARLNPKGLTPASYATIPVIRQKIIPPLPAKQADTTYISVMAVTTPVKPAPEVAPELTVKKTLLLAQPAAKPADVSIVSSETRKADVPLLATVVKSVLSESGVRSAANPKGGSAALFKPTLVVPPKRVIPSGRATPDPQESDLERVLNRKKRPN